MENVILVALQWEQVVEVHTHIHLQITGKQRQMEIIIYAVMIAHVVAQVKAIALHGEVGQRIQYQTDMKDIVRNQVVQLEIGTMNMLQQMKTMMESVIFVDLQ